MNSPEARDQPGQQAFCIEDPKLEGLLLGPLREEGLYLAHFKYSKDAVRQIREGMLVCVESFSSEERVKRYNLLEIVEAKPIHYALGTEADKLEKEYFGFVEAALKSCSREWEQTEPVEEATRIRVIAALLDVMLVVEKEGDGSSGASATRKISISEEVGLPMPGAPVRLLTKDMMERVINRDVPEARAVTLGRLLTYPEVRVKANAAELIRTHLGIFGFTRAGKSNLASNIIAGLLRASAQGEAGPLAGLKVVVVDYTNEYFPMLADCFMELDKSYLLILDLERLPDGFEHVLSSDERAKEIARVLVDNMVVPDELAEVRDELRQVLKEALKGGRVKVLVFRGLAEEAASCFREVPQTYRPEWIKKIREALDEWAEVIESEALREQVNVNFIRALAGELESWARRRMMYYPCRPPSVGAPRGQLQLQAASSTAPPRLDPRVLIDRSRPVRDLSDTQRQCLREIATALRRLADERARLQRLPDELRIGVAELIEQLNARDGPGLWIATSERVRDLCRFLHDVALRLYGHRRVHGVKRPLVLFMVDEADEFAPAAGPAGVAEGAREESRRAAETIARRAGKLGIGIGLITQRVTFLDTRVLGQLHTYFVSKLPRRTDRERVAEAFGASLEVIDKTLRLRRGQWMVISHSALGVPVTPFLIRARNAAERVKEALSALRQRAGEEGGERPSDNVSR